jgi:hypothetical protein
MAVVMVELPALPGFDVAGSPALPQAASWKERPRMAATADEEFESFMAAPLS